MSGAFPSNTPPSGWFRQLRDIRRNPPRLIARDVRDGIAVIVWLSAPLFQPSIDH
jgi:hypothetical protein